MKSSTRSSTLSSIIMALEGNNITELEIKTVHWTRQFLGKEMLDK